MTTGLARFVQAQEASFERALAELRAGRKQTHWMWYIFPQLRGLGQSAMAWRYGIADLAEARAYLGHTLLGPRLLAATQAVNAHAGTPALSIFGTPDDMKFRSCVTLFGIAAPAQPEFQVALRAFFAAQPDAQTLRLLAASSRPSG